MKTIGDFKKYIEENNLPDTMPMAVMNTAIEDDESCPGFEITDFEAAKNDAKATGKALFILFNDETYIDPIYNING